MGFLLNAGYLFDFNTTLDAADADPGWLRIAAGILTAEPDNNEELSQEYYYDKMGSAETDVVGAQEIWSFEGHRKYGDAAQDKIYDDLKYKLGPARHVAFRVTFPDGATATGEASLANITGPGGDANSKGEIGFEMHFNEIPTFTAAPVVP